MRPGFLCVVCPDAALLRDAVDAVADEARAEASDVRRMTFWGDDELPSSFWDALSLQGFDPAPRVIVLRHAELLPAATLRRVSAALGRPNPQSLCILCLESAWEKGAPRLPAHVTALKCYDFAMRKGWHRRIPPLTEETMRPFVLSQAERIGLAFAPKALDAVLDALRPDASSISTELRKLALLAGGRDGPGAVPTVRLEDASCIAGAEGFDLFALTRALQSGRTADAWRMLHADAPDAILFPLLSSLHTSVRESWQAIRGDASAVRPGVMKYRKAMGERLGMAGLSQLLDAMHQADLTVKSGGGTAEQALERLAAELVRIFSQRRI